jgi:hypothetical protein
MKTCLVGVDMKRAVHADGVVPDVYELEHLLL